jgi:hypothetical protein
VAGVNLRGVFEISRNAIAAILAHTGGGHLINLEQARFVTGKSWTSTAAKAPATNHTPNRTP